MKLLRARTVLTLAILVLLAGPAAAQVAQTIVIDGVNDFDPANLLDADGGDTETKNWCADDPQDESPMDIGNVYITNDVSNLYIGFEYDRDCFASPAVNLGIAFSYGDALDGGTTDPFSRKIAWNAVPRTPDNIFYVVLDAFNYEVLYHWDGAAWVNISTQVNPGWGGGSDGLGMANDTGFEELALPLSVFGLNPGDPLHVEIWMTQDGTTKPPLDAVFSDGVQASTPSGTTFDVTTPVEMSGYFQFDIINAVDNDPPFVTQAAHRVDSQVRVTFNEPVDPTTAQNPANYLLSGGATAASVVAAAVDAQVPSIVHLTLSQDIVASADAYQVTVSNVQDLAGNAITVDGVHNVGCFGLKTVTFEGKFGPYLASNGTGSDGFTVEGSKFPLTFDLCDGADMVQVDPINEIWNFTTDFSFPVSCADGSGNLTVAWKFVHNCTTYESIADRQLVLDLASPVAQTLSHFWNDLDPTAFTDKDIDVVFTVDMSAFDPVQGVDEVALAGSELPLSFTAPYTPLVDDGTGQDATAGDQVYTATVTFPAGTLKDVGYKFLLNGSYECPETGNRALYLDDALYDTIGGANGPLVLKLAYYNRCYVIGRDVEVVFRVDVSHSNWWLTEGPVDVVLTGGVAPLSWDPLTSLTMLDDGVAPDQTAGDGVFSLSVVFPDSSSSYLEFKYAVNGQYEGNNQPNRFVSLDDTFDAVGDPQVLPVHQLHLITVTDAPDLSRAQAARIRGAMPNPFNPRTTIVYETARQGRVLLEILDARGRRVATLVDEDQVPGEHRVQWDGRGAASGVYYARLVVPGAADGAKLVLLK